MAESDKDKDKEKEDKERYENALAFATKKHEGQFRVGGLPYITHPVAVAEYLRDKGYDVDYQIAGLFHDLLEDTDATLDEIRALGGEKVADAVVRLTKQKGYVMSDYVAQIKESPMARAVKAADRLHNLRCAVVTDQDFRRRYVLESIDWYLDLSPEIREAVKALAKTIDDPLWKLPLEYTAVDGLLDRKNSDEK